MVKTHKDFDLAFNLSNLDGSLAKVKVLYGRPWGTDPTLLFDRRQLIPNLRQLIFAYPQNLE
jgi:hypothetical protein